MRPYWAGFTVALMSLPPAGQSSRKGLWAFRAGGVSTPLAMLAGFLATLGLRASAIVFRIQLGEPGRLLRVAERDGEN